MPGFKVGDLGADTSADVKPFYKYTWELVSVFGDQAAAGPTVYAREATLPSWDFDIVEVLGGSIKYKFAGHVNFGDVKIVWYDTDGLSDQIQQWRDLVWSTDAGIRPASEYKKETWIRSMTMDLESDVVWKMINSWPRSIRMGDLTYVDSDIKNVEVLVSYDWAEME